MSFVPSARLLWITALVVMPGTTALVYFPDGFGHWAGWLALAGAVCWAGMDLALSMRRLEELRLEAPDGLRATRGREFTVALRWVNAGAEPLPWLRHGLPMMAEFRATDAGIRSLPEIPAGRALHSEQGLLALKRGRYFIDACHVETRSRFGGWLIRRRFPLDLEVRVYPDLSAERRRLSGLFLHRGQVGGHAVRQVGKGREFEQLREYQHGDDYIDIDWKATARRGQPVTRTYQIERTQEVYVVVDHSRLSAREMRSRAAAEDEPVTEWSTGGSHEVTTQLERFLQCALILASVAERQGDLFGFISFADRVDRFLRAGGGSGHYHLVRDALHTLEPERVAPNFEELMITLRQRLTRRALVVMLVDLGDPLTAEQFYESVSLICRQHLVLVNMVRPEGARPLFAGDSGLADAGDLYRELSGHLQWSELGEIGKKLGHLGVEMGLPEHEELCADVVTRYLKVKKRQLI